MDKILEKRVDEFREEIQDKLTPLLERVINSDNSDIGHNELATTLIAQLSHILSILLAGSDPKGRELVFDTMKANIEDILKNWDKND